MVKVVLLFQNTELRNDLSQLLLRHLNIFKYLALQSEFFTAFLFNSLQPGEGHVTKRNVGSFHLPLLWTCEVCSGGVSSTLFWFMNTKAVKTMMVL